MKKLVSALAAGALVLGALFMVTGCGPSSEEVIRNAITQEMDSYKNMDDSAMSEIATMAENEGISELGIDDQEFAAAVLDGFDYNIDDITVDGDTATATVTIVSKSYSDFEERITNIINELTDDPSMAELDSDQIVEVVGERVMQAFDEVSLNTETATIEYKLNGNVWEPVDGDSALADLDSVVFAQ